MSVVECPGVDICIRLEQRPSMRWHVYGPEDFERLRIYLRSHPELKGFADIGVQLVGLAPDRHEVTKLGP
jgi:hypothetical protein